MLVLSVIVLVFGVVCVSLVGLCMGCVFDLALWVWVLGEGLVFSLQFVWLGVLMLVCVLF